MWQEHTKNTEPQLQDLELIFIPFGTKMVESSIKNNKSLKVVDFE